MLNLKKKLLSVALKYSDSQISSISHWLEIEKKHSEKGRHYHTLHHLSAILEELEECKSEIENLDILQFATFYHDIIYKSTRKDNEEKSALLAIKRLTELSIPKQDIDFCNRTILATKKHDINSHHDINLFTDADLSILGQSNEIYTNYCRQIRKEYAIYPDLLYKPGRKKVIEHFLEMSSIFKTDFFKRKYESNARVNLTKELENYN